MNDFNAFNNFFPAYLSRLDSVSCNSDLDYQSLSVGLGWIATCEKSMQN